MNSLASKLSRAELDVFKAKLLNRQSELIAQIEDRYGLQQSHTDAIGELSSYDNHPADLGTELFEREKDSMLVSLLEKELEEINKALYAIEEGTYGICRVCSMDIPRERLEAIPTTDTCIEHAAEEKVQMLTQRANQGITDHATQRQFDATTAWDEVGNYGTSDENADTAMPFSQLNSEENDHLS